MVISQDAKKLLIHQLNNMFLGPLNTELIDEAYKKVLDRLDYCFLHIKNKYYHDDNDTVFNPLHSAQWTMFLYYMSREVYKNNDIILADKIYGLLKLISSSDIFYCVEMPQIWFFDHPQGSVMGRAEYSDFFMFEQGCTVGNNKGIYPKLSYHVIMLSGSKVLGNCNIGDHVIFSANCYVVDRDIESYSMVFGSGRDIVIKSISPSKFDELTSHIFKE